MKSKTKIKKYQGKFVSIVVREEGERYSYFATLSGLINKRRGGEKRNYIGTVIDANENFIVVRPSYGDRLTYQKIYIPVESIVSINMASNIGRGSKMRIKKTVTALFILAFVAAVSYNLYPAHQYGEIQISFQTVSERINSWWNESGNYSSPVSSSKPEINILELEKQIHVLINEERKKQGLPSLSYNDKLNIIARKHSQDMANRNYFSHKDPEHHDFSYRYRQEDFNCKICVGNYVYIGAENIFQNNLYDSITYYGGIPSYNWNSQEEIAESTVKGWMNSPGHRQNILAPFWKSEGIGVAISDDDKVYITENFC
jgi:uncharacterized protein YkwD